MITPGKENVLHKGLSRVHFRFHYGILSAADLIASDIIFKITMRDRFSSGPCDPTSTRGATPSPGHRPCPCQRADLTLCPPLAHFPPPLPQCHEDYVTSVTEDLIFLISLMPTGRHSSLPPTLRYNQFIGRLFRTR